MRVYRARVSRSQSTGAVVRIAGALAPLYQCVSAGLYPIAAVVAAIILWGVLLLRTKVVVDSERVRITNTWRSYSLLWTDITGVNMSSRSWPFWTDYVIVETPERQIAIVATGAFDFSRSGVYTPQLVRARDAIRSCRSEHATS
jgi:hypothetical protein